MLVRILWILHVCKQFRISKVSITQKVNGIFMQNLRYTIFQMKANILQDFHICISVLVSKKSRLQSIER